MGIEHMIQDGSRDHAGATLGRVLTRKEEASLLDRVKALESDLASLRERYEANIPVDEAFKKDTAAHIMEIRGFIGMK